MSHLTAEPMLSYLEWNNKNQVLGLGARREKQSNLEHRKQRKWWIWRWECRRSFLLFRL
jgi:hypothetical protein